MLTLKGCRLSKKAIISLSIVLGIVAVVLILFWTLFALSTVTVDYKTTTLNLNLTDEEIDKAVKDAEAHASEDKKKKEEIEARNNAESLVYNSQKTLDELGDKISSEEKSKAEAEIAKVNKYCASKIIG